MDWLDYREKLGVGFNDTQKASLVITNVLSVCNMLCNKYNNIVEEEEYLNFCTTIGIEYNEDYDCFESVMDELRTHRNDFWEFISRYVAFVNSLDKDNEDEYNRNYFIEIVQLYLGKANIPFEVLYDENNDYFIFPKGAKELDDALVSEPLE